MSNIPNPHSHSMSTTPFAHPAPPQYAVWPPPPPPPPAHPTAQHTSRVWDSIENLLQAQLYNLHGQGQKLDHIIAQLTEQQQQRQGRNDTASHGPSTNAVPSPLVQEVRKCFDDGIERVKAVVQDLAQQAYTIPFHTQFEIPWTPVSITERERNDVQLVDQSSPTLAPAFTLDELIDMRPYENGLAGLDRDIEIPPSDGMDYDNMSLSSGIESLPSEYRDSRLPTPDDFHLAVESTTTPTIGSSGGEASVSPTKRSLRTRHTGKRPDYVNHPMDSTTRRKRRATTTRQSRQPPRSSSNDGDQDASSSDGDSVRGLSTARVVFLPASDGERREGGQKWWAKGQNTLQGRMREVSCEVCKGRVHWACAGLSEHNELGRDAWACPDCLAWLDTREPRPPMPESEQQERCCRPDCIMRSTASFIKRPGDESRHFVDHIIGRRVLSRRRSGKRVYEYLILWEGWPLFDCTWEPPNRVDGPIKDLEEDFLLAGAKEGLNDRAKVVLLPEAQELWDENGDLQREYLEELGVPPAEWWPKPRGRYTLKVS